MGEAGNLAVSVAEALAARLAADTPGSEIGDLAVNWAPLSVAAGGLEESWALDATIGGFLNNGTVRSLGTTVAGLGAETPGTPLGDGAVHRAETGIAIGGIDEEWAGLATESRLSGDLSGLELSSQATGDGAGAHLTPNRNLAVDRAVNGTTGTLLPLEGAFLATVGSVAKDLAGVGLFALVVRTVSSAGLGAFGPFAPITHDAINGALLGLALLLLDESGAGVATILALADDGASAGTGADTTGMGALGPGRPSGNPAVYRAHADSARAFLGSDGACLATVAGLGEDITGTLLVAGTAGLGAGGPGVPLFHDAVDGAGLDVAGNLFTLDATEVTAELGAGQDKAGAGHGATAARDRAGAVFAPGSQFAVNGTRVGTALALIEKVGAHNTTMAALTGDGAFARLFAGTAGLGAFGPFRPGSGSAVNGAWALSAGLGLSQGSGAGLAAVKSDLVDYASAGLFTGSAGLGAFPPGRPGRNLAVDGAELGVALLSFVETRALVSTPKRMDGDLAGTGHCAGATGFGARGEFRPGSNFAVLGARASVAGNNFFEHTTGFAAELGGLDGFPGAGPESSTAGRAAFGVGLPGAVLAVNGATVSVARLSLLNTVALATVVSLGNNLTDTKVLSSAAAL